MTYCIRCLPQIEVAEMSKQKLINKIKGMSTWTSGEIADFYYNECHWGHPFDKRKFVRKDKVLALIEELELPDLKG